MLHNADDGCLSSCPAGGSLGSQIKTQYEDNGYSLFKSCNAELAFERASESASLSGLGTDVKLTVNGAAL